MQLIPIKRFHRENSIFFNQNLQLWFFSKCFISLCQVMMTRRLEHGEQWLNWKCIPRSFIALRNGKKYRAVYAFGPHKKPPHVSSQPCAHQRAHIWRRDWKFFPLCANTETSSPPDMKVKCLKANIGRKVVPETQGSCHFRYNMWRRGHNINKHKAKTTNF